MPRDREWLYIQANDFVGGIDNKLRDDNLSENQLVTASNIYFQDGLAKVDTGYTTFLGEVLGVPQKVVHAKFTDTTSDIVLITTTTVYKRAAGEWQYIPTSVSTTVNGDESAGQTTITVTDSTGFSAGDYVGIALDNGTQHQTTIATGGISGNDITIDDAIPTHRTALNGASFVQAVTLNGDDQVPVSLDFFPAANYVIFTNTVDAPKVYDKTNNQCIDLADLAGSDMDATLGTDFKAEIVLVYNNYLFFMNVEESGTRYNQRIRWASQADPTDWTSTDAGFIDLLETAGEIITAKVLQGALIVYKENSIVRGDWVGAVEQLINYRTTVVNEGALSLNSVIEIRGLHYIVGTSTIYTYDGSLAINEIGQPVKDFIYSVDRESDLSKRFNIFTAFAVERDEFLIFYPSTSEDYPDTCLRYNFRYGSWAKRTLTDPMVSATPFTNTSGNSWSDLTGQWTNQTYSWTSPLLNTYSNSILLCGSGSQIYSYDYSTDGDNPRGDLGTIEYILETKDFFTPNVKTQLSYIECLLKGYSIKVDYSIDAGQTYNRITVASPGDVLKIVRMNCQATGNQIRFRFTGTQRGFQIGWFGIKHKVLSEFRDVRAI